jgi:hypothetical protein
MKMSSDFSFRWSVSWTLFFVACMITAFPNHAAAQSQGQNIVWSGSTKVGSSAFFDATQFPSFNGKTYTDLCGVIYATLANISSSYTNGLVVDARGVTGAGTISLTCPAGSTPWTQTNNTGTSITTPSTILLPAGVIKINDTWILPDRTRVVGEGMNGQISGHSGTVMAWASTTNTSGPMVQFGSSSLCTGSVCTGISFQGVFMNGEKAGVVGSTGLVGIQNNYAQDESYVDAVNFYDILGTGLSLGSGAEFSGPYTNLKCQPGDSGSTGSTTPTTPCIELGASNTLGIHGVTCTFPAPTSTAPPACIQVDGSFNSIEDIHFENFNDGILVGPNSSDTGRIYGDVIVDVTGADPMTGAGVVTVNSAVHVCGSFSSGNGCASTNRVRDVNLFGVVGYPVSGGGGVSYIVEDDMVDALFPPSAGLPFEEGIGMYFLGEPVPGTKSTSPAWPSRFTTSGTSGTNSIAAGQASTWFAGDGVPSSTTACNTGSVYSNTGGGSGTTLYVCVNGNWVDKE